MCLAPDELLSQISQEIAYHKGKVNLETFWNITKQFIDISDISIKDFVLRNLLADDDIQFLFNGSQLDHKDELTYFNLNQEELHNYEIKLSDDKLWLLLTNYTSKDSNIGGMAFELLLEIAKNKEKGINTLTLQRNTKQDSRSFTGRLNKLGSLIISEPCIFKGHVTKHLVYYKFNNTVREKKTKIVGSGDYIDWKRFLPIIVETVKNSKNQLRQVLDLRRELKFDKERKVKRRFQSGITWLVDNGYLKKVFVLSPINNTVKIVCVQYIRDLKSEEQALTNFDESENEEEENDDDDDDDEDKMRDEDEDTNGAGEDEEERAANLAANQNILQAPSLIIEDAQEINGKKKQFLVNRFHPLQTITNSYISQFGKEGATSMQTIDNICGNDYKRPFTRSIEFFADAPSVLDNTPYNGFRLIKVYDFEGKRKHHRFFTEDSYLALTSQKKKKRGPLFEPIIEQQLTLKDLEEKNLSVFPDILGATTLPSGEEHYIWYNDLNTNVKKEVKKRTHIMVEGPKASRLKEKRAKIKPERPLPSTVHPRTPGAIEVNGFSGTTLKSLQRQRAIMQLLMKNKGVLVYRDSILEDVARTVGLKTVLDRKTFYRDIEDLRKCGKLRVRENGFNGKSVYFGAEISDADIDNYLGSYKESKKKTKVLEVIKSSELYFYDKREKDKFNRVPKSVKRVEEYQVRHNEAKLKRMGNKKSRSRSRKVVAGKPTKSIADIHGEKEDESTAEQIISNKVSRKTKKEPYTASSVRNLNSKDGIDCLMKCTMISKSLKGQVLWTEIQKIFPKNSLAILKKQYIKKRTKLGHDYIKSEIAKWKRIMVNAVQQGLGTLEDAEKFNLAKLLYIWKTHESTQKNKPLKLFKVYEKNFETYTLVDKYTFEFNDNAITKSSMVQRQKHILRKTYTVASRLKQEDTPGTDEIKSIIKSVLISDDEIDTNTVALLKAYQKDDIDKAMISMAKEKQLSFIGASKLQLTDVFFDFMVSKGRLDFFEGSASFARKLNEILSNNKGWILSEEPSGFAMYIYLGMLEALDLNVINIPVNQKEEKFYYASRRFETGSLISPLLLFQKKHLKHFGNQTWKVPIPSGPPFSKLWIDKKGNIRDNIWKNMLGIVLWNVLFYPGIDVGGLSERCSKVLSRKEIENIVEWLESNEVIAVGNLDAIMMNPGFAELQMFV
ncbi:transcription factor TFIIIC subunit TFC3 SCDLUD_001508 [Saccharomycodes ludwigii]|uniref:transcription factor TFIIIC subunit TFC3 n=1 Tax=Saccharomycodes ludwigii TaxID=36035 RepID=UPI001E84E683|nr:hypothetical protein SCDLUD_001508 [Saccharomycodes ludwigii]KAH3901735.1 hypothetical protein SCDLUD_001508 [Saccharomycodes ludwigii]